MHIVIDEKEEPKDWVRIELEYDTEQRTKNLQLIGNLRALSKGELLHLVFNCLGRVASHRRYVSFEEERVHWDEEGIASDIRKMILKAGAIQ